MIAQTIPARVDDDIVLRCYKEQDLPLLVKALDQETTQFLGDTIPQPYTMEDALEFYDKKKTAVMQQKQWQDGWIFAIEYQGQYAGAIGYKFSGDIEKRVAEIGYWLRKEMRGRGIMPRAIKGLVQILYNNTDCMRIEAYPFEVNLASQRVLAKAGFEFESLQRNKFFKRGKIHNAVLMVHLKDVKE
ncbi:acyl-CoA N-acyltransferase, partial [Gorgonomyces haynaldii]